MNNAPAVPSTSGHGAAAGGAAVQMAPVAAGPHGPVMQIYQKKVPVFQGKKDKDTLTILGWCNCIDGLKDALGWSDEATYANASAALFGNAQRTAKNWAILYKAAHRKTGTYLKKKVLAHYSNVQDSRSFINAMFGTFKNLDVFMA